MLELLYQTRTNTALTCIALLVLSVIANRVLTSYRIRRLGVRAPRVRGWLLFDIDIVISSIRHSAAHLDLEFWSWIWSHGKPTSPTVEFPIGGQRFIFTAEPENIKAILATQFADYGKGETFHRDWKDFLGDGIFATDGDLWHNSRQLMRPQFIKSRVSDLEIFEKHSAKLISLLGGKGQEVEVSELFYRFTLDTAMEYLLGHTVHSLDEPDNEYAAAFAEIQRVQVCFDVSFCYLRISELIFTLLEEYSQSYWSLGALHTPCIPARESQGPQFLCRAHHRPVPSSRSFDPQRK